MYSDDYYDNYFSLIKKEKKRCNFIHLLFCFCLSSSPSTQKNGPFDIDIWYRIGANVLFDLYLRYVNWLSHRVRVWSG